MLVIRAVPNPSQTQLQGTTVKLKSAEAQASWKPSVIELRGVDNHRGRVVRVSEQIELHNSSSRLRLSEEVL
jgi:hypothetical protein